ncbi:MAG: hypothetical protein WCD53_25350 [Microcoleus sp.]
MLQYVTWIRSELGIAAYIPKPDRTFPLPNGSIAPNDSFDS